MSAKAALLVICTMPLLWAQNREQSASARPSTLDVANAQCVVRMPIAPYPALARQALLTGSVEAVVSLGRSGAFQNVKTYAHVKNSSAAGRLLAEPVEAALTKTRFKRDCEYRRLLFVFEFALTGNPNDVQPEFEYGFPNHFWVTAQAPILTPPKD